MKLKVEFWFFFFTGSGPSGGFERPMAESLVDFLIGERIFRRRRRREEVLRRNE